jgi:hypothetical protein
MNRKTAAVVLIVAVAIAAGVALRSINRADAAAGNCYSATAGPSEPTVCS